MAQITITDEQLASVGLHLSQHRTDPQPDQWHVGLREGMGDIGPYASREEALLAGIRWLRQLYEEHQDLWRASPPREAGV